MDRKTDAVEHTLGNVNGGAQRAKRSAQDSKQNGEGQKGRGVIRGRDAEWSSRRGRSIFDLTSDGVRFPIPAPRILFPVLLLVLGVPLLLLVLTPLLALVLRVEPARLLADLQDPAVAQATWLSLITSALTTLITLLGGTPVAYLLARRRFYGHTILDTLLDLPLVLPPAVAGIALLVAFGRRGLFGQYLDAAGVDIAFTEVAVVLAQTFVAAPLYVKSATSGFAGVDQELEQVAGLDGASPTQVFRLITVPLAGTALLGGLVMTWARALGEFGATIIFAGNFPGRTQTMPLAIYIGFEIRLDVALTLAIILLATSFAVLFVVKGILRQRVGEG